MSVFSSSFPDTEKAIFLYKKFNLSFLNSIKHLLDVCENVIDQDLFYRVQLKIETISRHKKHNGFLYFYNAALINAVKKNDIHEIKTLFYLFFQENDESNNLFLDYEYLNNNQKKIFFQISSYGFPEKLYIYPVESENFQLTKEKIILCLDIIKNQLPDFYQEMSVYLSQFLLFNFSRPKAGSSFNLYGIIYLNTYFYNKSIVELIDFIVHEASHMYLYLICSFDSLVLNSPEDLYDAPFRSDKRPMAGIYHACFVLHRIIYAFHCLLEKKELDRKSICLLKEKSADYQVRLKKTFLILDKHADLTKGGNNLLKSMKKSIIF